MKNIEKERIEAKLKLWETPGFSQFVADLDPFMPFGCIFQVHNLKKIYQKKLQEIEEKESKFKQGKLEL